MIPEYFPANEKPLNGVKKPSFFCEMLTSRHIGFECWEEPGNEFLYPMMQRSSHARTWSEEKNSLRRNDVYKATK